MKKTTLAATVFAAATSFGIASPAQAITIISTPDPCVAPECTFKIDSTVTATTFLESISFLLPTSGVVSGSLTNTGASAATSLMFSDVYLEGPGGQLITFDLLDANTQAKIRMAPVTSAGTYTLYISGTGGGLASYGGNFAFAADVPEPATWAMLVLGIGMVGGAMRRRTAATRASRAAISFA